MILDINSNLESLFPGLPIH